jgi:hypothetical protein
VFEDILCVRRGKMSWYECQMSSNHGDIYTVEGDEI